MHRDSSFCAKSVRYNIFTNGAPSQSRTAAVCDPRTFQNMHISVGPYTNAGY